jgi:glycine cleavage system H protein
MTKFTPEHQWIRVIDATNLLAQVGITDHAQETLGDVVFVQPPQVGQRLSGTTVVAEVESVKAASDVYAPVSGVVTQINSALIDQPGMVNTDPMGEAWFFEMKIDSLSSLEALLSIDDYHKLIGK